VAHSSCVLLNVLRRLETSSTIKEPGGGTRTGHGAVAEPSEVLVSRVVTDLVAGAGLKFADRGSHELKGLPGRWELLAASL